MKKNLEALEILEDGMYVRTNEGIDKFEYKYKHNEYDFYIYHFQKRNMSNPEFYIIGKPSFNLTELIEKGDYVNGVRITEIKDGKPFKEDYNDPYFSYYFEEEDIKSIVTKEQFESMKYKVGE